MNKITTLPLLLLPIAQLASTFPTARQTDATTVFDNRTVYDERTPEVWVRDFNTLNSTLLTDEATPGHTSIEIPGVDNPRVPVMVDMTSPANLYRGNRNYDHLAELAFENERRVNDARVNGTLTNSADRNATLDSVADTRVEASSDGVLTLSIVNKLPSDNVKVYVSGLVDRRLVMLGRDGRYVHPTTQSAVPEKVTLPVAIPLGRRNTTLTLPLPGFIESARIWIVDGDLTFYVVATPNGPGLVEPAVVNPADINSQKNYAFVELSWAKAYGIYANISQVDYVGLPLGMELEDRNTKHSILGLPSNAAPALCEKLKAQAKRDGRPWDQLCVYGSNGRLLRVLAPPNLISQKPDIFTNYFGPYADTVWRRYTNRDLIIDTQTQAGKVACRVRGDLLHCAGDNRPYAKPNAKDIFGCNYGPFAIQAGDNGIHLAVVPRLCAAFNRGMLNIRGGDVQPSLPPSAYYSNPANGPKNWYSKFVHDLQYKGRGYAFSYDDVTPTHAEDQSGLVSSTSPTVLRIIIGGT